MSPLTLRYTGRGSKKSKQTYIEGYFSVPVVSANLFFHSFAVDGLCIQCDVVTLTHMLPLDNLVVISCIFDTFLCICAVLHSQIIHSACSKCALLA